MKVKNKTRLLAICLLLLTNNFVFSGLQFDNETTRFILKNSNSQIKITPTSLLGWQNNSIISKVSNAGLGDYNLLQDDHNSDKILNYSGVPNTLLSSNWNIPANSTVNVSNNAILDGNGNIINLGENSQLLIDDNVTLTLKNIIIKNVKNGTSGPTIKLASNNSRLVLDKVDLNLVDDFLFDTGHLFIYNDVNVSGTSVFTYSPTIPSYIKSGGTLRFNPGTTFYFNPNSPGTVESPAKDLLMMDDSTSRLWLDGCNLISTETGIRLTKGQLILENKVSLSISQIGPEINPTNTTGGLNNVFEGAQNVAQPTASWSPDGNYVVVGSYSSGDLKTYVVGSGPGGLLEVGSGSISFGMNVYGVAWSPTGNHIVAGGTDSSGTIGVVRVYDFTGSGTTGGLVPVNNGAQNILKEVYAVSWSPSSVGSYIAVGAEYNDGESTYNGIVKTYSFDAGTGLTEVGSGYQSFGVSSSAGIYGVAWSPNGSYIVASGYDNGTGIIKTYTFTNGGTTGGLNEAGTGYMNFDNEVYCFYWSPNSQYIAAGTSSGNLKAYNVTGSGSSGGLEAVGSGYTHILDAYIDSIAWTLDGQYVFTADDNNALKVYEFIGNGSSGGFDTAASGAQYFGTIYLMTVAVRPDNKYVIATSYAGNLKLFQIDWIGGNPLAISNSIVFGNSAAGSTFDLNVKLLAGANVLVTGIINYDNVNSTSMFSNDNARFILNNPNSKIRLNPSTIYGWRDSSIVNKVSGIGLGDYNLKQYDYNLDNILTYSYVSNSMQYTNWDIPANTIVHIKENIYMNGYGGTINLGENSELFVDDNVTLTLRNVVVKNSKNFVGNPAIKLASTRSKLALDNTTLNIVGDFYFDRGQLFTYNDVNFCGTNSFVYRSTVPSYITSGANLKFGPNTTFDFRPSTIGTPGLLAKDLFIMQDASSQLYLDGCGLKTTLTGMRLTKGQILFDNKVSLTSAAQLKLKGMGTWVSIEAWNNGRASSTNWSPDGRYLAAGTYGSPEMGHEIQIYSFNGSSLSLVAYTQYYVEVLSVNWSPDGRYLAVGGNNGTSGNGIKIYSFNGSSLSLVASQDYVGQYYAFSVNWSPDGRYLAVGNYNGVVEEIQIFSFNGSSLSLVFSQNYGEHDYALSVNWSPDGRYLAVGGDSFENEIQVYSFNGSTLTLVTSEEHGNTVNSVNWSPDGRYLAVGSYEAYSGITVYNFNGSTLDFVTSQDYGDYVNSVNWSHDGRYLAVGGANPTSGNELQVYSFDSSSLTLVASQDYGSFVYSLNWSPDGKYLSIGGETPDSGHAEIEVYTLQYGPDNQKQALSNSIVFGNSIAGSASDLNVKLLSGANISVDGILNYDNINSTSIFSNDTARFILKDNKSIIRMNPSTIYGWQNSSIINNASNAGLGDYNLMNDDSDKILNYSGIPNTLLGSNWNIPANTVIHVNNNSVLNGNGNSINLGENSELFVDDNVTLTLRNVVVKNSKNFVGNPAIKLASTRSKLALDNTTLNIIGDFYFDRGQLFAYNDVNFCGTNSFVYRSTVPSYITSGANLKFGPNTTFDFRPSTTGMPGLLAKDLFIMQDATSQLYLDGCGLKTTLTGMRLTKGQILFDNKVSLTSAAQLQLKNTGTWVCMHYGFRVDALNWSPDGRYLAVGGVSPDSGNGIQIYSFNGSVLTLVASQAYGSYVLSVNWSPDGRYLAVGGQGPISEDEIQIYSFNGSVLTLVTSQNYGDQLRCTIWSPDGRYLAVGGYAPISGYEIQIYSFNGSALTLVTSQNYGGNAVSVSWSSDGRYLAVGGNNPDSGDEIQIYNFNGSALTLVTSRDYGNWVVSINWSPDGRYLAVGGQTPPSGKDIQIYSFNGSTSTLVASQAYGAAISSINWSPDGRYLAVGGVSPDSGNEIQIYSFNGSALTLVTSQDYGANSVSAVNWSPDGRYLAIGGNGASAGHDEIEVYTLQYGPDNQKQVLSNSIVFGNSIAGSASDLNVKLLSGADISVDGIINYDNVNSTSIFSNDNARFTITGTNSKIRLNPSTVIGWQDRSLIKNITGGGLGDYNLRTYSGADDIVTYAEAPDELVYDNSNAIIKLDRNCRTDSNAFVYGIKNNSNTLLALNRTTSNALLFGDRNNSNAIVLLDRKVRVNSNAMLYLNRTTSNALLFGDRNNSNAIVFLDRKVRVNSNAMLYLNRTTSNALRFGDRNNSNAIVLLDRKVRVNSNAMLYLNRTNSNAFAFGIKNNSNAIIYLASSGDPAMTKANSNAIVSWIKSTSNTANWLNIRVRTDSNAFAYSIKNNSNAIIKIGNTTNGLEQQITNNSNSIKYQADHFITVNNGKFITLGGITGTTAISGRGLLSNPIDLQGGTLTLGSDMILSNQTTIDSSGNFDLQGNAIIFGGDLTLPTNVAIKVVSSGILDGQGNELKNAINAKLIIDNSVTLTLRNINWLASGSTQIEMRSPTSKLTLQNTAISFDRDYSFTQGQLFIQDDVLVTGTNKFSYASTGTCYIASHSTLYFDKNTTFSYSPRLTKRHTQSERNLIKMADTTSEIYFDECTLQLPDSGWQLINGTIYFDNKVTVYGSTAQENSFEFGNGSVNGDVNIQLLSGALLNNFGYIYYHSSN